MTKKGVEMLKRRNWILEEGTKKFREMEVLQGQGRTIAEAWEIIEEAERIYDRLE